MSVVVNDAIVTNDGNTKTYTYEEILLYCADFCGAEVTGNLRERIKRWINLVLGEMFTDAMPEWMLAQSSFDTVAEYTTGNATFTKGSKTVAFAGGAAILTSHVGRKVMHDTSATGYVIASRTSATEVELKHAFQEDTATSVGFKVVEDTYSLASEFDLARIVDQHFSNVHMQVVEDLNPEFRVSSRPVVCKITLDKNIVLYPAPDRIIRITYDFFRDFAKLSTLTATTSIPDRHVAVLSYGVARNYWMALSQGREAGRKAELFARMFEKGKVEIRSLKYMDNSKLVQFIPYQVPGIGADVGNSLASELLG